MLKITVDNNEYDVENISDKAKLNLEALKFCESKLMKIKKEIAVIETAKIAYIATLKEELKEGK